MKIILLLLTCLLPFQLRAEGSPFVAVFFASYSNFSIPLDSPKVHLIMTYSITST